MRCIKLFFFCIFVFPCNCFSQDNLKDISSKDSINNFDSLRRDQLQFKNFFRNNSKKLMSKDDLFGLELYVKAISDSVLITQPYAFNTSDYSEEELTYFKDSFKQLMEIAKKNHYKYDLGEVGRYLGISRKILAIILAILSVVK